MGKPPSTYRSRLCAKEFRASDPQKAGCFAKTPPLEALGLLLSMCVSEWDNDRDCERTKRGKWKILFMDATRAHFHSPVMEAIYVDLPPEESRPGYCARLVKSMYGTRQAAANWEAFTERFSKTPGFCKEHQTRICSYTRSVVYGYGCTATTLSCLGFMMT